MLEKQSQDYFFSFFFPKIRITVREEPEESKMLKSKL